MKRTRRRGISHAYEYGKGTTVQLYDATAEAMRTGKPYQTRLDPPPGPPADAEGNFLPCPPRARRS